MRLSVLLNIKANIYSSFLGFLIISERNTVIICLVHSRIYNFLSLLFNQHFIFFYEGKIQVNFKMR